MEIQTLRSKYGIALAGVALAFFAAPLGHAASADSTAFTLDTRSAAESAPAVIGTGVIGVLTDNGTGSLRDSIAGATSGDTLTFDAVVDGMTITLGGTQLTVGKNLTISATTLADGITVSANGLSRVFEISPGNAVAMDNLIVTGGDAGGGSGGGIFNNGSTLALSAATVSGNTAAAGGGIDNSAAGGLTLTNTTLSGNSATDGGGIRNVGGALLLVNATLALNTATGFGGGIDHNGGTLNIENSIVAANAGPVPANGPDIAKRGGGTVVPAGANLIGANDTVAAEFPAGPLAGTAASPVDPILGALGDYGGNTETMVLLGGSPAVDNGFATGSTPTVDQRGLLRPRGVSIDLGAYESGQDTGYALWALENIPSGDDSSFSGDGEGDGLRNGGEYGFKLNPAAADNASHPEPGFVDNGGNLEMHVTIPFRPGATDLIYVVERGTELNDFSEIYRYDTSTAMETITSPPDVSATVNAGAMEIDVIDRNTSASRTFWRFRVELITP